MLFQLLDTLRSKPKAVRSQLAFGAAVACIVLVGGVWSLSLPARLAQTGIAAAGGASSTLPTAPFAGIFAQLKAQFKGVKDAVSSTTVPVVVTPDVSSSTLRDTEAALNMQINNENKAALDASSSSSMAGQSSGYGFGTTSTPRQTIIIATTSASTAP